MPCSCGNRQLLGRGYLSLSSSHPSWGSSCRRSEGRGGEQDPKGPCGDWVLVAPQPLLCANPVGWMCGTKEGSAGSRTDEGPPPGQCCDWEKGWNAEEGRSGQARSDGQWWRRSDGGQVRRSSVAEGWCHCWAGSRTGGTRIALGSTGLVNLK